MSAKCEKHDRCRSTNANADAWMHAHREEYIDPETGELNATRLAEAAAHNFDHEEWLDDSHHWVWDLAATA